MEFEGAFYHVTSRENMREWIFFEDRDRERFLEILKGYIFYDFYHKKCLTFGICTHILCYKIIK